MAIKELSIEKFTEIISSDQMKTVKNLHLLVTHINEYGDKGMLFAEQLIEKCLDNVDHFFEKEFQSDLHSLKEFFKGRADHLDIQNLLSKNKLNLTKTVNTIGPFVIELTQAEADYRKDVFRYHGGVCLPSFRETAEGRFAGEKSVFVNRVNYLNSSPDNGSSTGRKAMFIKPNPKFPKKSSLGFINLINDIAHEPYIEVEGDHEIFSRKQSEFLKNFIGPGASEYIREQRELNDQMKYIQKYIICESAQLALILQKNKPPGGNSTGQIQKKNGFSWLPFFCSCCSLIKLIDYKKLIQEIPNPNDHELLSKGDSNQSIALTNARSFSYFSVYAEDSYSASVEIPLPLKESLIKAYTKFFTFIHRTPTSSNSIPDQLEKLVKLLKDNKISDEEFLAAKRKILDL